MLTTAIILGVKALASCLAAIACIFANDGLQAYQRSRKRFLDPGFVSASRVFWSASTVVLLVAIWIGYPHA